MLARHKLSGRPTPIRPSVAMGASRQRRLPCWGRCSKRADLLRFRLSFHFFWFQASSLHQTPIGDLGRSLVSAPCPRNSSVPSLVHSKLTGSTSSWIRARARGRTLARPIIGAARMVARTSAGESMIFLSSLPARKHWRYFDALRIQQRGVNENQGAAADRPMLIPIDLR